VISRALRREVKRAVRYGVWGISLSVGGGFGAEAGQEPRWVRVVVGLASVAGVSGFGPCGSLGYCGCEVWYDRAK